MSWAGRAVVGVGVMVRVKRGEVLAAAVAVEELGRGRAEGSTKALVRVAAAAPSTSKGLM